MKAKGAQYLLIQTLDVISSWGWGLRLVGVEGLSRTCDKDKCKDISLSTMLETVTMVMKLWFGDLWLSEAADNTKHDIYKSDWQPESELDSLCNSRDLFSPPYRQLAFVVRSCITSSWLNWACINSFWACAKPSKDFWAIFRHIVAAMLA